MPQGPCWIYLVTMDREPPGSVGPDGHRAVVLADNDKDALDLAVEHLDPALAVWWRQHYVVERLTGWEGRGIVLRKC
ncbi:MAG: hypothetical protein ABII06_12035 [Pseudomonadota bacterium]